MRKRPGEIEIDGEIESGTGKEGGVGNEQGIQRQGARKAGTQTVLKGRYAVTDGERHEQDCRPRCVCSPTAIVMDPVLMPPFRLDGFVNK